jgi:glycosyltransferase involved in cell wall biosynthesis
MMHLVIVIPAYNEGKVIRKVINSLPRKLCHIEKISVIIVNDGSSDDTAAQVKETGAILVSHSLNMGVGSATITGFEAAKMLNADIVVTMDGDGQHDARDIPKLIKSIIEGKTDIVIGTRLKSHSHMPPIKKIGNVGLSVITYLLSGRWTSDSQSGFKAFSRKAIENVRIEGSGYEFCSELIMEAAAKKLKIQEIPIQVIYTSYSRKKGQPILNGVNIVAKLIFKKITG